jgi:hypothetical protein
VASGPEGLNVAETIRRGSVRFGLGLPIFVTDTFAIGPRFDLSVPFAGNACARVVYMGARDTECTAVKALEEELNVDSSELPLPFTFLIELRAMLGVF